MQELINKGIMAIVPEYVKDRGNCEIGRASCRERV